MPIALLLANPTCYLQFPPCSTLLTFALLCHYIFSPSIFSPPSLLRKSLHRQQQVTPYNRNLAATDHDFREQRATIRLVFSRCLAHIHHHQPSPTQKPNFIKIQVVLHRFHRKARRQHTVSPDLSAIVAYAYAAAVAEAASPSVGVGDEAV